MLNKLLKELKENENKGKAKFLGYFFKTGKGQYGEGDKFLGITVPVSRKIAKKYYDLSLKDIKKLLRNEYHEARLVAVLILVQKYKNTFLVRQDLLRFEKEKNKIFKFYLLEAKHINNWDLVDLSAGYIIGDYLKDKSKKDREILIKLAHSKNLWEKRISVISTFAFIFTGEYEWTFKIVDILMNDKHDLIHKACGWMLREVGKRVDEKELLKYLDNNKHKMPRTMLRYAIERLPKPKRKYYLKTSR